MEYLGHHVSAAGIKPLGTRVVAINNFPQPQTKHELLSFLGMVNFYRRFIQGAVSIPKPLTDVTRGTGGKLSRLAWTEDMSKSFRSTKIQLASAAELAHPVQSAELSLVVDAGGALQQRVENGGWQPQAFYSRKLNQAEMKYSTFDRELLACVSTIRHFHFLVEGRCFHVLTDHKPLVYALHRVSDPWSAQQQRHLAYISEYTENIRHVSGSANVVADALSRPASNSTVESLGESSMCHVRHNAEQPPAAAGRGDDNTQEKHNQQQGSTVAAVSATPLPGPIS